MAAAETYYADGADGDDSYDGLAETREGGTRGPKRTWTWISYMNAPEFLSPGDSVLFRRGTTYGDFLGNPYIGAPDIGAFEFGAAPMCDGELCVAGQSCVSGTFDGLCCVGGTCGGADAGPGLDAGPDVDGGPGLDGGPGSDASTTPDGGAGDASMAICPASGRSEGCTCSVGSSEGPSPFGFVVVGGLVAACFRRRR